MDSASGFLAGNFSGGKIYCFQTKFQEEGVYDPKSDTHDVTDWSTDYMLCKTYCVTVLCTY